MTPSSHVSIQALGSQMFHEDPGEVGDLYLHIAEAYIDQGQYIQAKRYLAALVMAPNYSNFVSTLPLCVPFLKTYGLKVWSHPGIRMYMYCFLFIMINVTFGALVMY